MPEAGTSSRWLHWQTDTKVNPPVCKTICSQIDDLKSRLFSENADLNVEKNKDQVPKGSIRWQPRLGTLFRCLNLSLAAEVSSGRGGWTEGSLVGVCLWPQWDQVSAQVPYSSTSALLNLYSVFCVEMCLFFSFFFFNCKAHLCFPWFLPFSFLYCNFCLLCYCELGNEAPSFLRNIHYLHAFSNFQQSQLFLEWIRWFPFRVAMCCLLYCFFPPPDA